jgi:hypothetical protein
MKFSYRSAFALGLAALVFAPGAWAQGCVLCYTSLASSGPGAMHAFQMAMFALLIPALLLFLALFFLIFRSARTKTPADAVSSGRAYRVRVAPRANPLEGRV